MNADLQQTLLSEEQSSFHHAGGRRRHGRRNRLFKPSLWLAAGALIGSRRVAVAGVDRGLTAVSARRALAGSAIASTGRSLERQSILDVPLKFGSWELANRMLLAPLESVSDCAYRKLCSELGASFTWTEMVRASGLAKCNKATLRLVDTFDPRTRTGVQLLAVRPQELRDALRSIDREAESRQPHWANGIHGIDLNFGCPSPDVIGHGAGPALLGRPTRLRELFDVLAEWRAATNLPVGVIGAKIRLGMSPHQERQRTFLKAVEHARGRLDYITVHARNAKDESAVPARWENIRRAKEAVGNHLLVVGNGDVFTRSDAARMMEETGCDAVLVARGAIRSAGLVFSKTWSMDHPPSTVVAADFLEDRYLKYARQFDALAKYRKYHREAFRRVRERVFGDVVGHGHVLG